MDPLLHIITTRLTSARRTVALTWGRVRVEAAIEARQLERLAVRVAGVEDAFAEWWDVGECGA